MIISRTPFRMSFFGGGTDYPAFYREHGGAVLSTTINKYCYVICRYLPPFFEYNYRIRYTRREETRTIDEIQHPSVRECLKFVDFRHCGVEIQHNADLPAMSGIGSSSAFTVGLLNGLYALKGQMRTKRQLAIDAIRVEQDRIGENVGSQDQTAAAFGGFNKIVFGGSREIWVHPVTLPKDRLELLQSHLILLFTGFSRSASDVAADQIKNTPEKTAELQSMMGMVEEAIAILSGNEERITDFGKLLHEAWKLKSSLSGQITNHGINEIYEAGMGAGALGGKLLGAGGGGFMLFFVKPELRRKVRERLGKLLHVPFAFHDLGTQIVYYAPEDNY